ncbi:MAG: T9SS type A sorting domain-containing protein, partial [Bacteroidota bacterium]
QDQTAPSISCPADLTVTANNSCEVIIADYTTAASATDDCDSNPVITQSPANGTTITTATTVWLYATDANGNVDSCSFQLTPADSTAPVVNCRDITLVLDGTGTASITADSIDNGSFDQCGSIAQLQISQSSFGCADIGNNVVVLTATDNHGNVATCAANVEVVGNVPATIVNNSICQGDSLVIDGTAYKTAGPHTITLTAANGCDSLVQLNLNVQNAPVVNDYVAEVCQNEAGDVNLDDYANSMTSESGGFVWYFDAAYTNPIASSPPSVPVSDGDVFYGLFTESGSGCKADAELSMDVDLLYCSLPVELMYFEGEEENCEIYLRWATETETNSSHFIIEKSSDGINFEPIGQIEAAGSSSHMRIYEFVDANLQADNFYRLQQVDLDGSSTYYDIILIKSECAEESFDILQLYPNPVISGQDLITLIISSKADNSQVELIIYDELGRALLRQSANLKAGSNKMRFDTQILSAGTYFLRVVEGRSARTISFIKVTD